jgi:two-component system nitrate/nitrite response regulator NarL
MALLPFEAEDNASKSKQAMNHNSEPARVRLCLLDERALFRESVARLLAAEPGFELVAECATPSDVLDVLNRCPVDLVVSDVSGEGSAVFISDIRRSGYEGKLLVVTSAVDAASSARALKLGVSGIFLESKPSNQLIQAIWVIAGGGIWLDQEMIQLLAGRFPLFEDQNASAVGLTDRQQTVLQDVVSGFSNRKIADRLGVSEGTVKSTLQQLFAKAGVRTRSQLVRAALEGSLAARSRDIRKNRD